MPRIDFDEVLNNVLPPEDQEALNKIGLILPSHK
jgi:hypothetical protein